MAGVGDGGQGPGPRLRERPRQQRSREKVDRVLRATAELLDAHPYEEIGTKLIAERAGVSVGVLYRYFPDKDAIAETLVRAWQERNVELVAEICARPPAGGTAALFERLLDGFAQRFRTEPGYRRLWRPGAPRLPGLAGLDSATNARISALIHRALVDAYGLPDTETARRQVALVVEVADFLLGRAFWDTPEGDAVMLRDAVELIDGYLAPLATSPAPAS
ncbi:TetR/AcrR family transcriptional regulator [Streptomyces sp. NPDC049954]|uniref:TetR/AcrR family transcriptional regulator n=1 Tax=Streptomyces sp. NPDC049954 TaxID=3155779 RepID=UPI00343BDE90